MEQPIDSRVSSKDIQSKSLEGKGGNPFNHRCCETGHNNELIIESARTQAGICPSTVLTKKPEPTSFGMRQKTRGVIALSIIGFFFQTIFAAIESGAGDFVMDTFFGFFGFLSLITVLVIPTLILCAVAHLITRAIPRPRPASHNRYQRAIARLRRQQNVYIKRVRQQCKRSFRRWNVSDAISITYIYNESYLKDFFTRRNKEYVIFREKSGLLIALAHKGHEDAARSEALECYIDGASVTVISCAKRRVFTWMSASTNTIKVATYGAPRGAIVLGNKKGASEAPIVTHNHSSPQKERKMTIADVTKIMRRLLTRDNAGRSVVLRSREAALLANILGVSLEDIRFVSHTLGVEIEGEKRSKVVVGRQFVEVPMTSACHSMGTPNFTPKYNLDEATSEFKMALTEMLNGELPSFFAAGKIWNGPALPNYLFGEYNKQSGEFVQNGIRSYAHLPSMFWTKVVAHSALMGVKVILCDFNSEESMMALPLSCFKGWNDETRNASREAMRFYFGNWAKEVLIRRGTEKKGVEIDGELMCGYGASLNDIKTNPWQIRLSPVLNKKEIAFLEKVNADFQSGLHADYELARTMPTGENKEVIARNNFVKRVYAKHVELAFQAINAGIASGELHSGVCGYAKGLCVPHSFLADRVLLVDLNGLKDRFKATLKEIVKDKGYYVYPNTTIGFLQDHGAGYLSTGWQFAMYGNPEVPKFYEGQPDYVLEPALERAWDSLTKVVDDFTKGVNAEALDAYIKQMNSASDDDITDRKVATEEGQEDEKSDDSEALSQSSRLLASTWNHRIGRQRAAKAVQSLARKGRFMLQTEGMKKLKTIAASKYYAWSAAFLNTERLVRFTDLDGNVYEANAIEMILSDETYWNTLEKEAGGEVRTAISTAFRTPVSDFEVICTTLLLNPKYMNLPFTCPKGYGVHPAIMKNIFVGDTDGDTLGTLLMDVDYTLDGNVINIHPGKEDVAILFSFAINPFIEGLGATVKTEDAMEGVKTKPLAIGLDTVNAVLGRSGKLTGSTALLQAEVMRLVQASARGFLAVDRNDRYNTVKYKVVTKEGRVEVTTTMSAQERQRMLNTFIEKVILPLFLINPTMVEVGIMLQKKDTIAVGYNLLKMLKDGKEGTRFQGIGTDEQWTRYFKDFGAHIYKSIVDALGLKNDENGKNFNDEWALKMAEVIRSVVWALNVRSRGNYINYGDSASRFADMTKLESPRLCVGEYADRAWGACSKVSNLDDYLAKWVTYSSTRINHLRGIVEGVRSHDEDGNETFIPGWITKTTAEDSRGVKFSQQWTSFQPWLPLTEEQNEAIGSIYYYDKLLRALNIANVGFSEDLATHMQTDGVDEMVKLLRTRTFNADAAYLMHIALRIAFERDFLSERELGILFKANFENTIEEKELEELHQIHGGGFWSMARIAQLRGIKIERIAKAVKLGLEARANGVTTEDYRKIMKLWSKISSKFRLDFAVRKQYEQELKKLSPMAKRSLWHYGQYSLITAGKESIHEGAAENKSWLRDIYKRAGMPVSILAQHDKREVGIEATLVNIAYDHMKDDGIIGNYFPALEKPHPKYHGMPGIVQGPDYSHDLALNSALMLDVDVALAEKVPTDRRAVNHFVPKANHMVGTLMKKVDGVTIAEERDIVYTTLHVKREDGSLSLPVIYLLEPVLARQVLAFDVIRISMMGAVQNLGYLEQTAKVVARYHGVTSPFYIGRCLLGGIIEDEFAELKTRMQDHFDSKGKDALVKALTKSEYYIKAVQEVEGTPTVFLSSERGVRVIIGETLTIERYVEYKESEEELAIEREALAALFEKGEFSDALEEASNKACTYQEASEEVSVITSDDLHTNWERECMETCAFIDLLVIELIKGDTPTEPTKPASRGDMPVVKNQKKDKILPEDVLIDRTTKWGNRHKHGTKEENIRDHIQELLDNPQLVEDIKRELKGKNLVCHCAPKGCHGDIMIKIANIEGFNLRQYIGEDAQEIVATHSDAVQKNHDEKIAEQLLQFSKLLMISGSRDITALPQNIKNLIDKFAALGCKFIMGDSIGVDAAAQEYLLPHTERTRVCLTTGKNAYVVKHQTLVQGSDWTERDAYMTRVASCGIMVWSGKEGGTSRNIERAVAMDKPFVAFDENGVVVTYHFPTAPVVTPPSQPSQPSQPSHLDLRGAIIKLREWIGKSNSTYKIQMQMLDGHLFFIVIDEEGKRNAKFALRLEENDNSNIVYYFGARFAIDLFGTSSNYVLEVPSKTAYVWIKKGIHNSKCVPSYMISYLMKSLRPASGEVVQVKKEESLNEKWLSRPTTFDAKEIENMIK